MPREHHDVDNARGQPRREVKPTPLPDPYALREWQAAALPVIDRAVRSRTRAVVSACTGAGKTDVMAAYLKRHVLPSLQPGFAVVVTVPSQDLVRQTADRIDRWCGPGTAGRFYADRKIVRAITVCCEPSVERLAKELQGQRVALWLADECHKPSSVAEVFDPITRVGFTGTPYRSAAHERLTEWDVLAVRYSLADALRDGVIVPPRFVYPDTDEPDLDYTVRVCLEAIGPGVVSAVDIGDAETCAEVLRAAGVRAGCVHSRRSPSENRSTLRDLEEGRLKCVVQVAMLVEGVDLPWLRWGCIRREEKASVRAMQHLGRYLRVFHGRRWGSETLPKKTEAVIYDRCNSYGLRDLAQAAALGPAEVEVLAAALSAEAVGEAEELETLLPPGRVVEDLAEWIQELRIHGTLYGTETLPGYRDGAIRPEQLRALRWYADNRWRGLRRLRADVREAIKALITSTVLETIPASVAADLLEIAAGCVAWESKQLATRRHLPKSERFRFHFPWEKSLPDPPANAVEAVTVREKARLKAERKAARAAKKVDP